MDNYRMCSKINYTKNFFVLLKDLNKTVPKTLELYKAVPNKKVLYDAIKKHKIEDATDLKIVEVKIPKHMLF